MVWCMMEDGDDWAYIFLFSHIISVLIQVLICMLMNEWCKVCDGMNIGGVMLLKNTKLVSFKSKQFPFFFLFILFIVSHEIYDLN